MNFYEKQKEKLNQQLDNGAPETALTNGHHQEVVSPPQAISPPVAEPVEVAAPSSLPAEQEMPVEVEVIETPTVVNTPPPQPGQYWVKNDIIIYIIIYISNQMTTLLCSNQLRMYFNCIIEAAPAAPTDQKAPVVRWANLVGGGSAAPSSAPAQPSVRPGAPSHSPENNTMSSHGGAKQGQRQHQMRNNRYVTS